MAPHAILCAQLQGKLSCHGVADWLPLSSAIADAAGRPKFSTGTKPFVFSDLHFGPKIAGV